MKTARLLLVFGFLSTASTGQAGEWTGVYINAGGGVGAVVHDLDLESNPPLPPLAFSLDGLGAEGGFVTVGVGADYQLSNRIVLGAFVDYDWTDLETSLDAGIDFSGFGGPAVSAGAGIDVENVWSIGGRAGYLVTPGTLLFLTAGYAQADVSDLTAGIDGLGSITVARVGEIDGYFLGGGAEVKITKALSIKGEYRFTDLDAERITLLPGTPFEPINDAITTRLDPDIQTGRVSLAYRFGMDDGAEAQPIEETAVGSWSQFYLGIGGGYAFANNDLSLSEGPSVPIGFNLSLDGLGAKGGAFTFGAGVDRQIGERYVVGAFVDYTRHSADWRLSLSAAPFAEGSLGFGLEDELSVGARVGYLVSPATLLFGSVGYSRTRLDDTILAGAAGPFSGALRLADNGSFDGVFFGAGLETKFSDSVSLKAEYRYTNSSRDAITLLPGSGLPVSAFVRTELDPDVQTLRLSLDYRFDFGAGE